MMLIYWEATGDCTEIYGSTSAVIASVWNSAPEGQGKSNPITHLWSPEVFGRLRLLDFVTLALEGGRLSALRTGRLYLQEYPGTHFKRLSRPGHMELSDAMEKIPSDTTGDRSQDLPTSSAV
jgi:hypothetical protein